MQQYGSSARRIALAIMGLSMMAWTIPAQAQIPIPGTPTEVYSVPIAPPDNFTNTANGILDLDTVQIPLIVQSLTVTQGQASFTPANAGGGITGPSNIYPGWVKCSPNCVAVGQPIDEAALKTFVAAIGWSAIDQQTVSKDEQQLGAIEARAARATTVLTVLKAIADELAMDVQQRKYQRLGMDTLISVVATHDAQDLNDGMMADATIQATTPGEAQVR